MASTAPSASSYSAASLRLVCSGVMKSGGALVAAFRTGQFEAFRCCDELVGAQLDEGVAFGVRTAPAE